MADFLDDPEPRPASRRAVIEAALSTAVDTYGPALFREPLRLKDHLDQTDPEARTEITLLLTALEEQVPQTLIEANDDDQVAGLLPRLVDRMAARTEGDRAKAIWAVRTWTHALALPFAFASAAPVKAAVKAAPTVGPDFAAIVTPAGRHRAEPPVAAPVPAAPPPEPVPVPEPVPEPVAEPIPAPVPEPEPEPQPELVVDPLVPVHVHSAVTPMSPVEAIATHHAPPEPEPIVVPPVVEAPPTIDPPADVEGEREAEAAETASESRDREAMVAAATAGEWNAAPAATGAVAAVAAEPPTSPPASPSIVPPTSRTTKRSSNRGLAIGGLVAIVIAIVVALRVGSSNPDAGGTQTPAGSPPPAAPAPMADATSAPKGPAPVSETPAAAPKVDEAAAPPPATEAPATAASPPAVAEAPSAPSAPVAAPAAAGPAIGRVGIPRVVVGSPFSVTLATTGDVASVERRIEGGTAALLPTAGLAKTRDGSLVVPFPAFESPVPRSALLTPIDRQGVRGTPRRIALVPSDSLGAPAASASTVACTRATCGSVVAIHELDTEPRVGPPTGARTGASYEVVVRMDDRTIQRVVQRAVPAIGTRVRVADGQLVRAHAE